MAVVGELLIPPVAQQDEQAAEMERGLPRRPCTARCASACGRILARGESSLPTSLAMWPTLITSKKDRTYPSLWPESEAPLRPNWTRRPIRHRASSRKGVWVHERAGRPTKGCS